MNQIKNRRHGGSRHQGRIVALGQSRSGGQSKSSGFTLVEILVVISIGVVISALTIGGFSSVGASNKRTSCQANLTQIYAACQQYAADEGGKFPFYNPAGTPATNDPGAAQQNIGLWALYTFPGADSSIIAPVGNKPIERYLRSSKSLHCPNDDRDNTDLYTDETRTVFNPLYLSYQGKDPDSGVESYDSVRATNTNDADWKRQLLPFAGAVQSFRTPSDKTVVTWCPFHRTGLGGRPVDPVLFYDGSVQLIPVTQTDPDNKTNPTNLTDWRRKPRGNDN